VQWNGLAGFCYGPPIGAGCGQLSIELKTTEPQPAGFTCVPDDRAVPPRPDILDCKWTFQNDASHGLIDNAALEAACRVTVEYPTYVVDCINGGS
jgi:hypothetical protein